MLKLERLRLGLSDIYRIVRTAKKPEESVAPCATIGAMLKHTEDNEMNTRKTHVARNGHVKLPRLGEGSAVDSLNARLDKTIICLHASMAGGIVLNSECASVSDAEKLLTFRLANGQAFVNECVVTVTREQYNARFVEREWTENEDGYWIMLKDGLEIDGAHAIHEDTKQKAYARLKDVKPGKCPDCKPVQETTRTLVLADNTLDQEHTFNVRFRGEGIKCSLRRDYKTQGDGVYWALNSGTMLKSEYTIRDAMERNRLNADPGVEHGQTVLIDGTQYRCFVLGCFSNAAVFVLPEQWDNAATIARL